MLQLIHEIRNNHELIWALAIKELRIRYKRSVLGFLWSLLNPLLTMIVLTVVFSTIGRMGISHYAIFLLSALLPWTFMAQSLAYATESIVNNGELLKKVRIAKSVFPVAAVLANLINFLLSLIPMALLMVALRFPFHWSLLYLPVPLIGLVLFTLGCAFFCSAANVYFRDVSHIVQVVLSAWFYMCPIIYSMEFVPQRFRFFFHLNPMVSVINGFRLGIYYGILPSRSSIALSLGVGLAALIIGYVFFRRGEDSFVYYV